jgi:mRNA-degrading endonuclease RelE of RelBE toxin-antitoxin system
LACDAYSIDLCAIEGYIKSLKDASIKEQIRKKIKKVKEKPYSGERKRFKLKDVYAVKVNHQRIVITYMIDEEECMVVLIDIGTHDEVYGKTF